MKDGERLHLDLVRSIVLEEIDERHLYVIGGICDRDRERNMTQTKSQQLGLASRRLPIDEFVSLDGSKILTINAVFSILCTFRETGSWATAFKENLPARVLVKVKVNDAESQSYALSSSIKALQK